MNSLNKTISQKKTEHYFFLFIDENNNPDFIVLVFKNSQFLKYQNKTKNEDFYRNYEIKLLNEVDFDYLDNIVKQYGDFFDLKKTIDSF